MTLTPSDFLSSLALAVSVFTLYWTVFHKRKALYLVRIDSFKPNFDPHFALINGGKEDVLLTEISCCFESTEKAGISYPAQKVEFYESESYLIKAGQGISCHVSFLEKFTSAFALEGEPTRMATDTLYLHRMIVVISWIDMAGKNWTKRVWLYNYSFDETGSQRKRSHKGLKYDLYDVCPHEHKG